MTFAIWAAQFIGREIRWLNYYEAVGQPLAAHLEWCRSQAYTPQRAQFWLPHDGDSNDKVYDVSYASALKAAGYEVTVEFGDAAPDEFDRTMEIAGGFLTAPPDPETPLPELFPPLKP